MLKVGEWLPVSGLLRENFKKRKIQLLFNKNFVNQCLLLALKNTLEHVNV